MIALRGLLLALALGQVPTTPATLPTRTIAQGQQSGVDVARTVVVTSTDAFSALWKQHSPGAPPVVDFGRESVVAVFLGSRPSAGYAVELVSATASGRDALLRFRERRPSPDLVTAQVITSPFAILAVPAVAGSIRVDLVP